MSETFEGESQAARQAIESALSFCKSYQDKVKKSESIARHKKIPLMSDILAHKVSHLFSQTRPCVLNANEELVEREYYWTDAVRQWPLDFQELENGKFRVQPPMLDGVVELTKYDLELIISGIPRSLIHPLSHREDVLAEIDAAKSLRLEMTALKSTAIDGKLIEFRH